MELQEEEPCASPSQWRVRFNNLIRLPISISSWKYYFLKNILKLFPPAGDYMLVFTSAQWEMLQRLGFFAGISAQGTKVNIWCLACRSKFPRSFPYFTHHDVISGSWWPIHYQAQWGWLGNIPNQPGHLHYHPGLENFKLHIFLFFF